MAKASKHVRLSDQVITALLEKHACPLPFHAVRALFKGNITTPDITASPMQTIRDLWSVVAQRVISSERALLETDFKRCVRN
jgi:hypothetical protein